MARAGGRLLQLEGAERMMLLRAYFWLAFASVVLRFPAGRKSFQQDLVASAGATGSTHLEDLRRARAYMHWIDVAARHHVVSARCLHKSVALHRWLRWDGVPSALRIGVRKESNQLQAHAWVELGGVVVNDTPDAVSPFAPLVTSGAVPAGDKNTRAITTFSTPEALPPYSKS